MSKSIKDFVFIDGGSPFRVRLRADGKYWMYYLSHSMSWVTWKPLSIGQMRHLRTNALSKDRKKHFECGVKFL